MSLSTEPIFTQTINYSLDVITSITGVYIFKKGKEDRTKNHTYIGDDVEMVEVVKEQETSFQIKRNLNITSYDITDPKSIMSFLSQFDKKIFIDITGLSSHIWAPLINTSIKKNINIKIVYIEPVRYLEVKKNSALSDYSESQIIKPIPGFIVLKPLQNHNICFVPLLGFEKSRFELMMNTFEPHTSNTYPIVGLPGFKIEHPFQTYLINQNLLESDFLYQRIKYASANCPFALYYLLCSIWKDSKAKLMRICLIGTKPHALGSVLFSILSKRSVELIYDYPRAVRNKSEGISKIHIYHIDRFSEFLN